MAAVSSAIVVVNAGSSSLKVAAFNTATQQAVARGTIEQSGAGFCLTLRDAAGAMLARRDVAGGGLDAALAALLDSVDDHAGGIRAVGHRVVHGGAAHVLPARVTDALLETLDGLVALDPLHMQANIAPVRAIAAARPGLAQVVCFDTGFHDTLPPVARAFGLPRALTESGLRRYGFHGLSYEYIAGQLTPRLSQGRVIVAHLGSGASLCALAAGRSVATTMGYSALDGLVMATRCGSLDPGIILQLGRQGHGFADIETMLYRQSGLLGVSGISGDIRVLLASSEAAARDAVELFTYRIATEAGALVSALGGLDGLVFTAGIGTHAAAVRAAVCARLVWLGLRLNDTANDANAPLISAPDSAVEVRVIPTDEEAMIARHTRALMNTDGRAIR